MKTIPDAAKFLYDTGLLGEINRLVLHPRGMAMMVDVQDDGAAAFDNHLVDYRNDPEGMVMGDEYAQIIREKLGRAVADGRLPQISDQRRQMFPPEGIEPL